MNVRTRWLTCWNASVNSINKYVFTKCIIRIKSLSITSAKDCYCQCTFQSKHCAFWLCRLFICMAIYYVEVYFSSALVDKFAVEWTVFGFDYSTPLWKKRRNERLPVLYPTIRTVVAPLLAGGCACSSKHRDYYTQTAVISITSKNLPVQA